MINYCVIGGQYNIIKYGGTKTLLGAKRLATRNEEFWDNWQGWNKPDIYRAQDCTSDGYPKPDSYPAAVWSREDKCWYDPYSYERV